MKKCLPGIILATASLLLPPSLLAQVTWTGGAVPSDENWNAPGFANWSGNTNPQGQSVLFTAVGAATSAADVTNIVTQDYSISSLSYTFEDANLWQVTEIATGAKVTVGGANDVFTVGGLNDTHVQTTKVAIRGGGALEVNQNNGVIRIGNNYSGSTVPSIAILDMSGLSSFSANLGSGGTFDIGGAPKTITSQNNASQATVSLAENNQIAAGNFYVSARNNTGQTSLLSPLSYSPTTLHLGMTNEIRANTFAVGLGSANNESVSGRVDFAAAVHNQGATLKLRGFDGLGKITNLHIGSTRNWEGGPTGHAQHGIVDLTGGSVDALVGALTVGNAASSSNSAFGTLTMGAGTFVADTVLLGGGYSTGTGFGEGILNVSGGSFEVTDTAYLARHTRTVHNSTGTGVTTGTINLSGTGQFSAANMVLAETFRDSALNTHALSGRLNISGNASATITNGIIMGRHVGLLNAAPLTATISISGGSLAVNGDIAEGTKGAGTITSTVEVKGGRLEMNGREIRVDHFIAESGVVSNIGGIGSGGGLNKTTAGTLLVEGNNLYTGATQVLAGTLELHGSLAQGNANVANGATFSQLSTGALRMNISSETVADQFVVQSGGTATFAGQFTFDLFSLATPGNWLLFDGTNAASFEFLDQVNLTGAHTASLSKIEPTLWASYTDQYQFTFDTASGEFSFQIVPEPSSATMLLLAIFGGSAMIVRRRLGKRNGI